MPRYDPFALSAASSQGPFAIEEERKRKEGAFDPSLLYGLSTAFNPPGTLPTASQGSGTGLPDFSGIFGPGGAGGGGGGGLVGGAPQSTFGSILDAILAGKKMYDTGSDLASGGKRLYDFLFGEELPASSQIATTAEGAPIYSEAGTAGPGSTEAAISGVQLGAGAGTPIAYTASGVPIYAEAGAAGAGSTEAAISGVELGAGAGAAEAGAGGASTATPLAAYAGPAGAILAPVIAILTGMYANQKTDKALLTAQHDLTDYLLGSPTGEQDINQMVANYSGWLQQMREYENRVLAGEYPDLSTMIRNASQTDAGLGAVPQQELYKYAPTVDLVRGTSLEGSIPDGYTYGLIMGAINDMVADVERGIPLTPPAEGMWGDAPGTATSNPEGLATALRGWMDVEQQYRRPDSWGGLLEQYVTQERAKATAQNAANPTYPVTIGGNEYQVPVGVDAASYIQRQEEEAMARNALLRAMDPNFGFTMDTGR